MKPFVIAEFASCHMGSLETALQGIAVAHSAGAQAFKVQYWSSPERMRSRRHVGGLAYAQGSVPAEWHATLKQECRDRGLLYSASVFLPEDVPTLAPHVDYWKVSSFEARDRELTRLIPPGKPLFISTGMSTEHEQSYFPKRGIRLHCVSAYPCPPYEANLGAIERGQGYSDHTRCVFTGAFAVAAGADYLEVHYCLADTPFECADFSVSLNPDGLMKYIGLAREAYKMRGDGRKMPQPSELENAQHRVFA
jgi:N-acetylneuraminate synthase